MPYKLELTKNRLTKNVGTLCSYLESFSQRLSQYFYGVNVKQNRVIDGYTTQASRTINSLEIDLVRTHTITHHQRHELAHQHFNYMEDVPYPEETADNQGFWVLNIVDGDVNHSQNQLTWSNEFRTLLGYERQEDFPDGWENWLAAIHSDDLDLTLERFNSHVKDNTGNTPYVAKYRLKNASGHYVWIREQGNTIRNEQGLPLISLGAIRDISGEVQLTPS